MSSTKAELIARLNELSQQLIFDRTQADIDALIDIFRKPHGNVTEREKIFIGNPQKGAYNPSDRNRVSEFCNKFVELLREYYGTITPNFIVMEENWENVTDPTETKLRAYIDSILAIVTNWYNRFRITDGIDLTNTTWLLKEKPEFIYNKTFSIDFLCNGSAFETISHLADLDYVVYDTTDVYDPTNEEWLFEGFRTIIISGGLDVDSREFKEWLIRNATQINTVTDLTDTTWKIAQIPFSDSTDSQWIFLDKANFFEYRNYNVNYTTEGSQYDNDVQVLTFTDGTDVTNENLISWLRGNGELVGSEIIDADYPPPSISHIFDGIDLTTANNIESALYKLYVCVSDYILPSDPPYCGMLYGPDSGSIITCGNYFWTRKV